MSAENPDDSAARAIASVDEPGHRGGASWRDVPERPERDGRRVTWLAIAIAALLVPILGAAGLGLAHVGALRTVSVLVPRDLYARQVAEGWSVGDPAGELSFPSECAAPDVPPGAAARLAAELRPPPPWSAWTRAELLAAPGAAPPPASGIRPLAEVIRPLCTTDTRVAHARGRSLAELLAGLPPDTAIVVDLPGPEAVAFAAALEQFAPVWTFETWPHPQGAAPVHLTLGALLAWRDALVAAAARRPPGAPPVFVLDAHRRTSSFPAYDNGYAADLPPPATLAAAGIRRVLLVRGRGSDGAAPDLRSALAAWHWTAGLPVHLVALQDFQPVEVPELPGDPGAMTWWWGGSPESHWAFRGAHGLPDSGRNATLPPPVGIPWVPERPAEAP